MNTRDRIALLSIAEILHDHLEEHMGPDWHRNPGLMHLDRLRSAITTLGNPQEDPS